jgi:hypothetical protein
MSSNKLFHNLRKKVNLNLFSVKFTKRNFQILLPEEYLENMKESIRKLTVENCKLRPLPEASKFSINLI